MNRMTLSLVSAHEIVDKHRSVAEAHTDALGAVDDVRFVAHLLDDGLSATLPYPPVGIVHLVGIVCLLAVLEHALHDGVAAFGNPELRADIGVHPADGAPEVGAALVLQRRAP
jgi:hypothetical protein